MRRRTRRSRRRRGRFLTCSWALHHLYLSVGGSEKGLVGETDEKSVLDHANRGLERVAEGLRIALRGNRPVEKVVPFVRHDGPLGPAPQLRARQQPIEQSAASVRPAE